MLPFRYVTVFAFLALAAAQQFEYEADPQPRPAPARVQQGFSGSVKAAVTPVPILKQINRHNEDGSYTYGYEGADGSFKIETKLPTGEVKGKYGYVDDTGKVRVVEYGATKYGFEPAGEGITVAPPTLVDETTNKDGLLQENYADYEPQPQPARARAPAPRPQYNPEPQQFAPAPVRSAPVPARAQVSGAQPVSDFGFTPRTPVRSFAPARPQASFSYASPAPAPIEEQTYEEPAPRPRVTYAQPRPQPQPQYQFAPANTQAIARPQPAPQQNYAPQPQPAYAPAPRAAPLGGRSGGVLDQLAKDYALPQGGAAPLHDISFGYY